MGAKIGKPSDDRLTFIRLAYQRPRIKSTRRVPAGPWSRHGSEHTVGLLEFRGSGRLDAAGRCGRVLFGPGRAGRRISAAGATVEGPLSGLVPASAVHLHAAVVVDGVAGRLRACRVRVEAGLGS